MMGATMGYLRALQGDPLDAITLATTARKAAEMVDWFRFGEMATASLVAGQTLAGHEVDPDAVGALQAASPDDVDNDGVAMFRARALALHDERHGPGMDDDALRSTVDLLHRNHKRAWLATFAAELLDSRTPGALDRAAGILERSPHSEVADLVIGAHRARQHDDASEMMRAARAFEAMGFPLPAARLHADVVRLRPEDDADHQAAVAGLVRIGQHWNGVDLACVTDLRLPSARQIEIAAMAMHGQSTRSIAAAEHLSERTVENHVYRLCKRVGAHGLDELRTVLAPLG